MQRRLWIAGLAVVGLVGGTLFWWLSRPTSLERMRAHLDATDPGWRLAEIRAARLANQPSSDENVVFTAVEAAKLIPQQFKNWQVAAAETETWPRQPTNWLPDDPDGVVAWRAATDAVHAARRCQHLQRGMADPAIPADPYMTLLPHLGDCRQVVELLRVDAVRATANGDTVGALASLRAILRIAQGVDREPFLVSHLTAAAIDNVAANGTIRCLAVGELPADGLAAIETDLRATADPASWATILRDIRAVTDAGLTAVAAGHVDLRTTIAMTGNRTRQGPNWVGRLGYRLNTVAVDHSASLTDLTDLQGVAYRRSHEWRTLMQAVPTPPDDDRHLFSFPEGVEVRRVFIDRLKWLAERRAAAVAVACERFRLAHGRWPTSLAELPPADNTDPYTGRPLRLKPLADGLLVYSIGPDDTDNDGRLTVNARATQGTDVGFRVWSASVRQQPSTPATPNK